MRVLIYGFGPYRQFRDNITVNILKRLPASKGLKKIVFPVRFDRKQFVRALMRHRPDIVLGLGQSSRRKIEIEARALNRRQASKKKQRSISAVGPKWLPTTLDIKPGRQARRSRNAGDYVCNYSMYVLLAHIARARKSIPFGFIHIPHDYERRKAERFVRRVLSRIAARGERHSLRTH
jgi:pyrrolidone-carboxylate peptidase